MRFRLLDKASIELVSLSDVSLGIDREMFSELGSVVLLSNEDNEDSILYYNIFRNKKIKVSVWVANLFAATHAYEYATKPNTTLNDIFDKTITNTLFPDYKFFIAALAQWARRA